MHHADIQAGLAYPGSELNHAAWISAGQDIGLRLADGVELASEESLRHLGMGEVVDPSRAATILGPWKIEEVHTRNGTQQGSGRVREALAVKKVAGVIVSYA